MFKNFKEKKYLIIGAMILAAGFLFGPATVKAATTVYFDVENQAISEGDTFVVNLKISTPDKSINVIDGTILYDSNGLEIKEISTGGSLLTLWPKPPVFSNDKGTLSFVGGVPDGFQDKKGEVLKIIFLAKSEGEAKIDFLDGFSVFLNDGRGTSINPWLRPLSLNILTRPSEIQAKDEWQALIEKDKTPPEFVEAIINRDPHLFDNQYFVSFFATDKDSGVAHYEIKEGDRDFIRAESPHLLQEQSLKGIVQIKAVDKAGNESTITPELALSPKIPYTTYFVWILVALAVLAFMFWLRRLWRRGWKFALFLGLSFILIFGVKAVNAATLYLSPSSGNFTVGNIFTVNVLVNTENADINNAEATINFPSGLLEVVSFSKSGSIFSLWVEEPKFSNGAGTLSLNGGLPTPGFKGTAGKVLGVVFRVKKAGSASLVFSSAAIRANDGYGTNVFRTGTQAIFNLTSEEKQLPPPEEKLISVEGQTITITSSTHPDQNKWYSNKNPLFKWDVPAGTQELILVLNKRANSLPIISYIPPISEKVLTDVEDGVWYMNARFRTASGLGPIDSFKFNIDTVPPRPFTITRVDTDDPTNPRPELLFESSDITSGIEKYQIKVGDNAWLDIDPALAGRAYAIPLQKYGNYAVEVKALDKAGNSTSSNTKIAIAPVPIPPPIIKEVVLPQTETDKVTVIKDEAEVVVKEVAVKEVVVKGRIAKEGISVKIAAVIVDVFKLENSNGFGQIAEALKDAEKKLVKTVEIPVDEDGNFEAKINDLDSGTYIIRIYGKDERGAVSDAYSDVVLKVVGESTFAKFIMLVFSVTLRGFDAILNFMFSQWLLLLALLVIGALVGQLVAKGIPHLSGEIEKIRYIASEYRNQKKLKKLDHKTKLELKILEKDIKKELDLLNKIANHRSLHPEESYLRNKLEKYYNTLKKL